VRIGKVDLVAPPLENLAVGLRLGIAGKVDEIDSHFDRPAHDFMAVLEKHAHVGRIGRTGIRIDFSLGLDDLVDPLPVPAHANRRDPQTGLPQPAIFHVGVIVAGVLYRGRHVLGTGRHDVGMATGQGHAGAGSRHLGSRIANEITPSNLRFGHAYSPWIFMPCDGRRWEG
jgi:hypothetical protein